MRSQKYRRRACRASSASLGSRTGGCQSLAWASLACARGNCIDPPRRATEETLMPAPAVSRSVLITGCSTGIGQSTALWLAERGWMVFATARQRESLEDLEAAARILLGLEWLLPD